MIAVVAGCLGAKPGNGGNAWSRLSWTRGLGELGADVYFVEHLDASAPAGASEFFSAVVGEFADPRRAALLDPAGRVLAGGLSQAQLSEVCATADILINLSGHLQLADLRSLITCAVYVDDDPGYTQFWHSAGQIPGRLAGHEAYYTFGARIGASDCPIPSGDFPWRPLRPPVVLADWPHSPAEPPGRVSTVASWRGPYGRVEFGGRRYGLKLDQLRAFAELPTLAGRPFEIALQIDPAEHESARWLQGCGWTLVEPVERAGHPGSFRRYVQSSSAELSVAQGIYVDTRCGWFSDRTTRYLASGRPALVQDTGFSDQLPVGEGLLAFRTPAEAARAWKSLESSFSEHAHAARALAEEHFDSRRVIGGLLEEVL